ncbi:NADP-dependent oxidoreductase domain-containing protein [Bombardia bombarda]|uniref:NADP-dependent oxidoreductase domain-containing protein n=1 Tax=Bombardia bombarda TaxID=252184 RepID=A0AA39XJ95_9PEZI|nr:NADP-dependent oxidoreductase domain-containing protein [Bombardia bombarda]
MDRFSQRQASLLLSSPAKLRTIIAPFFYNTSTRTCKMMSTTNPNPQAAAPAPSAAARQKMEMPPLIYGTAWKKERTADLVYQAIKAGFRGIDTAAMRRHYDEELTGHGIHRAIQEGLVTRADLYIQTKFSPGDDAFADTTKYPTITSQVLASVASSLRSLSTPASDAETQPPYLDSLVMHFPFHSPQDTLEAWATLSTLVPSQIRSLGISNVTLPTLELLHHQSSTPISVVQNRFRRAEHAWDVAVRAWCAQHSAVYQGFWTLTGNRAEWQGSKFVRDVAEGAGVPLATAWYALLLAADIVVLDGTTDPVHMREDVEGVEKVAVWRGTEAGRLVWERSFEAFDRLVGGV